MGSSSPTDNRQASNDLRRTNLRKFVEIHCGGVVAELLRKLGGKGGTEAYWRALIGHGKKSFSMEKALETEKLLHLLPGELLKENSQLELDPSAIKSHKDEVIAMLNRMDPEEHVDMLNHGAKLISRRQKKSVNVGG